MGFEAATDDLVDALRLLVAARVNDALQATLGKYPIPTTAPYPIPLDQIAAGGLPLLSVYRESETMIRNGARRHDRRTVFALDYFVGPVPLVNLGPEWPLLHHVWQGALDAIYADTVEDLLDPYPEDAADLPVNPLCDSGVVNWPEEASRVDYSLATAGDGAYPFFAGRITLDWRPVRTSNAVAFQQLFAAFNLYERGERLTDGDINPIVEQNLTNTGFDVDAFDLGFSVTVET